MKLLLSSLYRGISRYALYRENYQLILHWYICTNKSQNLKFAKFYLQVNAGSRSNTSQVIQNFFFCSPLLLIQVPYNYL